MTEITNFLPNTYYCHAYLYDLLEVRDTHDWYLLKGVEDFIENRNGLVQAGGGSVQEVGGTLMAQCKSRVSHTEPPMCHLSPSCTEPAIYINN